MAWSKPAALSCALIVASAGFARADVIDGHWCYPDGKRISIQGPAIVTPAGSHHPGRLLAPFLQLRGATDRPGRGTDRLHDADQRRYGAFAHRGHAVLFVRRAGAGLAPLRPSDKLTPERRTHHRCPTTQFRHVRNRSRRSAGSRNLPNCAPASRWRRRWVAPTASPASTPAAGSPSASGSTACWIPAASTRSARPPARRPTTPTAGRSSPSCRPTACSAAARWTGGRWRSPATTSRCAAGRRTPRSRASRRCRSRSRPSSACRSSG